MKKESTTTARGLWEQFLALAMVAVLLVFGTACQAGDSYDDAATEEEATDMATDEMEGMEGEGEMDDMEGDMDEEGDHDEMDADTTSHEEADDDEGNESGN